jgi:hypothetical protein
VPISDSPELTNAFFRPSRFLLSSGYGRLEVRNFFRRRGGLNSAYRRFELCQSLAPTKRT